MARSEMAGLFREMVDAFSANRRAVLAPELAAIRAALEAAGVEFTNGDELRVKLKKARDREAAGKGLKKVALVRRRRPTRAEARRGKCGSVS